MANFDATKGGATANSYATVDDADDYLEFEFGATEDWEQIDGDTKERLLVTATRMLDQFKVDFPKADDGQALKLPVTGYVDGSGLADDGFTSATEACIIQALFLYRNQDTIQEAQNSSITGTKSESLGKVSKSVSGFNSMAQYDHRALGRLAPFISLSLNMQRA